MRLYLIISCLACLAFTVSAQDQKQEPKESKTQLESFQAKTGSVLIKGMEPVGSVGKASVECREFTDAESGEKVYGITIEIEREGMLSPDVTLVDYDEIDSLIQGIDYVSKVNKTATSLQSFEAVYSTKAGLKATVFSRSNGKIEAAIQSGRFNPAYAFMSLEDLDKFKKLVVTAKAKLDQVKQVAAK